MNKKPEEDPEMRIDEHGKMTIQCYRCEQWFEVKKGSKQGVYIDEEGKIGGVLCQPCFEKGTN